MATVESLEARIKAVGDEIRAAKSAGASKEDLAPRVAQLLALKEEYAVAAGRPYGPPPKAKAKAAAPTPSPAPAAAGGGESKPSKKELNKLARKNKRAAAKGADAGGDAPGAAVPAPAPAPAEAPVPAPATAPGPSTPAGASAVVEVAASSPGDVLLTLLVAQCASRAGVVRLTPPPAGDWGYPCAARTPAGPVVGDASVARYVARLHAPALLGAGAAEASCVDSWLAMSSALAPAGLAAALSEHLETRTYVVGFGLTLADLALWLRLRGKPPQATPLERWRHTVGDVAAPWLEAAAAAPAARAQRAAAAGAPADDGQFQRDGQGEMPGLEGAVDGEVVTRFPPEPSGYLHIGHAKACLLNNYYARRYKGQLIVRFDDTNPSKEKEEFEENIKADLETLGIVPDVVSHTSDHFELCYRLAKDLITRGLAYMDNTPQETMQDERLNMIESQRRNTPPDENLALFEALCKSSACGEWTEEQVHGFCLRAKIDMSSPNGTLRDPVLYRYNATPHHRTKTRYCAYPTYDFACPVVDSTEGVTHALRTTEYNDRDAQYQWFIEALSLRPVRIHAFSRMNFVYTVLSKRKLAWFVDQGLVEGWFDPRFPTIQGVIRRGISIAALRKYILDQGASRRVVNMEWDKFWAENKKVYEPASSRYMAVFRDDAVMVHLENVPAVVEVVSTPLVPKDPSRGERPLRRFNEILIEGGDAASLAEGEEVTLLRWGNCVMDRFERDASGRIVSIHARLNIGGDVRKTKKITWLANVPDAVKAMLVEFDHLVTKKTLEDGDSVEDFVTPNSRVDTVALGDPALRNVQAGEVVQLERRGFFRCDRPYLSPDKPIVLFMIPDGKTRAMSTLSGALQHR